MIIHCTEDFLLEQRTIQKVYIGRDTKARTIPKFKQSCKCDLGTVPVRFTGIPEGRLTGQLFKLASQK